MDVDVPLDLRDQDSSIDSSDNEDEVMGVEGSLPNKASPLANTPPNRRQPRQDIVEGMDKEEEISTSRTEIDAASGLYEEMCDLRRQVSRSLQLHASVNYSNIDYD